MKQILKCVLCSEEYEVDTERELPKIRCHKCPGLLITKWEEEDEK